MSDAFTKRGYRSEARLYDEVEGMKHVQTFGNDMRRYNFDTKIPFHIYDLKKENTKVDIKVIKNVCSDTRNIIDTAVVELNSASRDIIVCNQDLFANQRRFQVRTRLNVRGMNHLNDILRTGKCIDAIYIEISSIADFKCHGDIWGCIKWFRDFPSYKKINKMFAVFELSPYINNVKAVKEIIKYTSLLGICSVGIFGMNYDYTLAEEVKVLLGGKASRHNRYNYFGINFVLHYENIRHNPVHEQPLDQPPKKSETVTVTRMIYNGELFYTPGYKIIPLLTNNTKVETKWNRRTQSYEVLETVL